MSGKRTIWIISEGSPGHVSQSTGLAAALAEKMPVETRQFETHPKINGLVRHFIRIFWMGKSGRPLPNWVLYGLLGLERAKENESPPDLIISSGGRSVFAARTLAVKWGVPFVFLGERKPYPPEWFHTVFTPSSLETAANDLPMNVIPTKITPELVHQAAADWTHKPGGRLWGMLIGGKSRSHDFKDADFEQLATGMAELAKREGIRWLVTSSRRTGKDTEAHMKNLLPSEIVADAVWWCLQPEKKFPAYLGAAEVLWVTQDSVSMVTEAVATNKPVIVIQPAQTNFPITSFMPGYLANLEALGLIARLPIARLAQVNRDFLTKSRPPINVTESIAEQLRERLNWSLIGE